VALSGDLEGHQETLDRITGGRHDGGAIPMVRVQSQGRREETETILKAGLGRA
jgi:hypothetical protein